MISSPFSSGIASLTASWQRATTSTWYHPLGTQVFLFNLGTPPGAPLAIKFSVGPHLDRNDHIRAQVLRVEISKESWGPPNVRSLRCPSLLRGRGGTGLTRSSLQPPGSSRNPSTLRGNGHTSAPFQPNYGF